MRDLDPSQYAEADRRKVNPPIQVDSATWRLVARSTGGLKSAGNGWVAYAVMMADKGGSRLLIFVRQKRTDSRGLSLSFIVRRAFTRCRNRLIGWIISPLHFDMRPRGFLSFPLRLARSSR